MTNDVPGLRHIALDRSKISRFCLEEVLNGSASRAAFEKAEQRLDEQCHLEFRSLKERLKLAYSQWDPDVDPDTGALLPAAGEAIDLAGGIRRLLERAGYSQVSRQALLNAFELSSLFDLELCVDLEQFEEVLLYFRGVTPCEEERRSWLGIVRRNIRFNSYDRVALFIRFRREAAADTGEDAYPPGSVMLKLFQNVPENDLEMLFPNTRVGMRPKDKLAIGIPAIISAFSVFTTKVGATLALLGTAVGFWLGLHSEQVTLDRATVLAVLAALGAVLTYFWKQFSKYRNRKLRFSQALTESLYFKLLDNNTGVILRLLDEAEDAEYKESLLAGCFLLAAGEPVTATQLERSVEAWFARRWQCRIDFGAERALGRLRALGVAGCEEGRWQVLPAWLGETGS